MNINTIQCQQKGMGHKRGHRLVQDVCIAVCKKAPSRLKQRLVATCSSENQAISLDTVERANYKTMAIFKGL